MTDLLKTIDDPKDLRELSRDQLPKLAADVARIFGGFSCKDWWTSIV